jgi:chromosome partitioning related protein ParA
MQSEFKLHDLIIPENTGNSMTQKIAVIGTKGGQGKTMSAANIAGLLASMGFRVLLVDADPRPQISKYFNLEYQAEAGLYQLIVTGSANQTMISHTNIPNLHLIYSDVDGTDILAWIGKRMDKDIRLKSALRSSYISENYDLVIIDTGGSDNEITKMAALAGDVVLCPVIPEILSAREFRDGTISLLESFEGSREPMGTVKVFFNRVQRLKDAKINMNELRKEFAFRRVAHVTGERIHILDTCIPATKFYTEASNHAIPVHMYDFPKQGVVYSDKRTPSAYEIMHQLVWEIFPEANGFYAGDVEVDEDQLNQNTDLISEDATQSLTPEQGEAV